MKVYKTALASACCAAIAACGSGTGSGGDASPVSLGGAGNFVVLAQTAISTVPSSSVTGDIGLSPAAASLASGFSLVPDSTNVFSSSTQVVGRVYAATYAVPTPANLTAAIDDMQTAYNDAAGRPADFLEVGGGDIGGLTLAPGVYKWTSTVLVPTDLTLAGTDTDVWIFQTSGDLTVSAAKSLTLSGGAQAKNVFWQVAGDVSLGTTSHLEGVVLCKTAITLQTGATLNGRAMAQSQVALQQATLTQP